MPASSYFVYIFSCDGKVLLNNRSDNNPPCEKVSGNCDSSWNEISARVSRCVFANLTQDDNSFSAGCRLVRLVRLWFPVKANDETKDIFLQRNTFFRPLTQSEKDHLTLCDGYSWTCISTLLENDAVEPDLTEVFSAISASSMDSSVQQHPVVSFCGKEVGRDDFIVDPGRVLTSNNGAKSARKTQAHLMLAAKFSQEGQKKLYKLFFSTTFPHLFMSQSQFATLMKTTLGWKHCDLKRLFRCYKVSKDNNFLSYPDFISGLAACEPGTPHGDHSGEARCRYIFRYYDKNGDGRLHFEEFCNMVRDIRVLRGASTDKEAVMIEAKNSALVFGVNMSDSITMSDFLTVVGQLKFRGTSLLLRSLRPVLDIVNDLNNNSGDDVNEVEMKMDESVSKKRRRTDEDSNNELLGTDKNLFDWVLNDDLSLSSLTAMAQLTDEQYELATHVVKVKRSGHVIDVTSLWDMDDDSGAVSISSKFSSTEKFQFGRMQSIRAFNLGSDANEMLRGLRYFERAFKEKDSFSWGIVDMKTVATALMGLCCQVKTIFMQEPRLVRLKAPAYILGDVHGNFSDLVCFEKALWRTGINLTPANFLFLGDYVDRGQHGVEVIAYMFAQKIISPTKFHLLRGNHETRKLQKNFTFHQECLDKFGENMGEKVWEEINCAFDSMPIAAVVDSKIFCVHGGIAPPWMGNGLITSLDKVSNDISDPEEEEPLVWEYLWNDPLPAEEEESAVGNSTTGFVHNTNRGTGHRFSHRALDEFLTRNKLTHVIRAHEVKQAGFQVQHKQKLLTVFSSSKYCQGNNDCACVLVDNKKIRLIRLDTS